MRRRWMSNAFLHKAARKKWGRFMGYLKAYFQTFLHKLMNLHRKRFGHALPSMHPIFGRHYFLIEKYPELNQIQSIVHRFVKRFSSHLLRVFFQRWRKSKP